MRATCAAAARALPALLCDTIGALAEDPELNPGGVPAIRWKAIREAQADLVAGGDPTLSELGVALGLPPQIIMCAFASHCMRLGLIPDVKVQ